MKHTRLLLLILASVFVLLSLEVITAQGQSPGDTIIIPTGGFAVALVGTQEISPNTTTIYAFHVLNETNGETITNSTASCAYVLRNNTGNIIFEDLDVPYINPYFFSITVEGANFSIPGIYISTVQCNSSEQGGGRYF